MSKNVKISQLGAQYRRELDELADAGRVAMLRAAMRGLPVVVEATPSDTGRTRAGWTVIPRKSGADLMNDSPVVGILEAGSRPHRPPLLPILRWVVRKFGVDLAGGKRSFVSFDEVSPEAFGMAQGVVNKIAREGTKPHWMVKNRLPLLEYYAAEEVKRALRRYKP